MISALKRTRVKKKFWGPIYLQRIYVFMQNLSSVVLWFWQYSSSTRLKEEEEKEEEDKELEKLCFTIFPTGYLCQNTYILGKFVIFCIFFFFFYWHQCH